MQGEHWIVNSQEKLDNCLKAIAEDWERLKWIRVQVQDGRKRTLDQNSFKERQYQYIHEQTGQSVQEVTRESKYFVGTKILCRDDEQFKEFCKQALGHLDHEQRLKAMDYVPVTRHMSKTQLSEYIEGIYQHWSHIVDWSGFEDKK